MWFLRSEKGRQVWEYYKDGQIPEIVQEDGHPTRTPAGISYNNLPIMTDGVVHSHMLPGGADAPTPLGDLEATFDPSLVVNCPFDVPSPITKEQVDAVIAESVYLSNPNTGDDILRAQLIPRDMYRPGSCTASNAVTSKSGVPNSRTVRKDKADEVHEWNMDYVLKRRENPDAELPVDYFKEKFAHENIVSHMASPINSDLPEDTEVNIEGLSDKDFLRQVEQCAISGAEFFKHVQSEDGHIPGDYGGPMFLMPGAIITFYVTGTHLSAQHKLEIIKYICSHQQKDGGWGLHIESHSTIFGTVMNYIALRLLGCEADHPPIKAARDWIKLNGGATGAPQWLRFWLAVLNLLPYEGMNAIFPEMWLMPKFLPAYPARFWCHCRMVYLPMAYIYGAKFQAPEDDLIRQLRTEIYVQDYHTIDFVAHRNDIAATDKYTDENYMLKMANMFMNTYEKYMPFQSFFRKRAMNYILDYVNAEDKQTNYIDIGPVNKFINMLCTFHAYGRESTQFRLHQSRILDYMWVAEDGIKCQGYNSSSLWDTAFCSQAFTELEKGINAYNNKFGVARTLEEQYAVSPLRPWYREAYKYVEDTQIRDETLDREEWYRQLAQGGWPFSSRDHGWPISDCTAEGLKASLVLHSTGLIKSPTEIDPICGRIRYVDTQRMEDAVKVMLTLQNYNGGWATYENTRGPEFLENLNPSGVFGGIMIDYSYVECTSACIQALTMVRPYVGPKWQEDIDTAVHHGSEFIQDIQREDGGWVGSWGVCFTYGTWFGIEGLRCAGFTYETSPAMQKGVKFLLAHQNKDGGWGESFLSCVTKKYSYCHNKNLIKNVGEEGADADEPISMVINTAWSVLALLEADYHLIDRKPIDNAIKFLLSRQISNGDWPQEGISGVFNGNCMITYTSYRSIFPIWAIGRFISKVVNSME